MLRPFHVAASLFALAITLVPVWAQQPDNGNIVGQIRISRANFPPDRIEVTLTTRGAIVNTAYTDNEGKFAFYEIPANMYHVTVQDPKYERYEEHVTVNPFIMRTNVISVVLTPKPGAKPDAEEPQVSGANPYMVSPAEYKSRFPKKAVKEFEKGLKYQDEGKLDDAAKHFEAALKVSPDFYAARNNLGAAYLGQGNLPAARTEFETVLGQNAGDVQAYFNLGNVLLLTGQYQQAQRTLEEGVRRQPNAAFGRFLLGSVLVHTSHPADGERELRKAQELDPQLSKVHLELVNLYLKQHRAQDAIGDIPPALSCGRAGAQGARAAGEARGHVAAEQVSSSQSADQWSGTYWQKSFCSRQAASYSGRASAGRPVRCKAAPRFRCACGRAGSNWMARR